MQIVNQTHKGQTLTFYKPEDQNAPIEQATYPHIYTRATYPQQRWPHFSFNELKCSHSDQVIIVPSLLNRLHYIRREVGPLPVTSGYRSVYHPVEVDKPHVGTHALGWAVDIAIDNSRKRFMLIEQAINSGLDGIGVAKDFIHIDGAPNEDWRPRPALWTY